MREAGVPAHYWENAAARLAAPEAAPVINDEKSTQNSPENKELAPNPAPVQAPLIEADEPATARIEIEVKPVNTSAEHNPAEPPPSSVVCIAQTVTTENTPYALYRRTDCVHGEKPRL